jgi:hypothetical protein
MVDVVFTAPHPQLRLTTLFHEVVVVPIIGRMLYLRVTNAIIKKQIARLKKLVGN